MNNQIDSIELEKLLDAYMIESETPRVEILENWIKRYPQYERELTEFTVAWSLMETYSEKIQEKIDWTSITLQNQELAQQLLDKKRGKNLIREGDTSQILGLLEEGKGAGYTIEQLASETNLSTALVRKLDRRLITYLSIPLQVIEDFANVLRREVLMIAQYLALQPEQPARVSFKANRAPSIPQQESFFDAVRNDLELEEDQRKHWLAIEQDNR